LTSTLLFCKISTEAGVGCFLFSGIPYHVPGGNKYEKKQPYKYHRSRSYTDDRYHTAVCIHKRVEAFFQNLLGQIRGKAGKSKALYAVIPILKAVSKRVFETAFIMKGEFYGVSNYSSLWNHPRRNTGGMYHNIQ
jgi:hypothetical protein